MPGKVFDLVVIGGGINGCAVARQAALQGFRVALLERNDFGCGVTSRSTRLIHGGLRYLESGKIGLVRESLHDRRALLRDYPGQVKPLQFLIPVYQDDSRAPWYIQVGLKAYGFLAKDGQLSENRRLSPAEVARLAPALDRKGLRAGFLYYDCQAPYPERLALEMALEAEAAGATVLNHTPVTGLIAEDNQVKGVRVKGSEGDREIRARLTINAAGAWIDQVREMLPGGSSRRLLTLLTGTHIVVRPFEGAPAQAIYHEARSDKRPFFIVPWRELLLIGTTEIPFEGDPEQVRASVREVSYLIEEANRLLPGAKLSESSVLYAYSGPRPLLRAMGDDMNAASREHSIYDHAEHDHLDGMLTMVGGKLTTARTFARQVVAAASKKLGHGGSSPKGRPATHPNGRPAPPGDPRLYEIYGWRADRIRQLARENPGWDVPLAPSTSATLAEIVYAIREEKAATLGDLLLRRTGLAFDAEYQDDWARKVAGVAAPVLGWSQGEMEHRLDAYALERERTLSRLWLE